MGYDGLRNWMESDNASDIQSDVEHSIYKSLMSGFRRTRQENCFNTPGAVNVCLILESGVLDGFKYLDGGWSDFLHEVKKDMEELIEEAQDKECWDSRPGNRTMHLNAYLRMMRKLNQIMDKIED